MWEIGSSALKNAFHTGILCWINQGKVIISIDRQLFVVTEIHDVPPGWQARWHFWKWDFVHLEQAEGWRVSQVLPLSVCCLRQLVEAPSSCDGRPAAAPQFLPPSRSYIIILTLSPPILTNSPPSTWQSEKMKLPARSAAECIMNQVLDMQCSIKHHKQTITCKS